MISQKIENARGQIMTAVNNAIMQNKLPACIIEGIVASIMIDLITQSKIELINEFNSDERKKDLGVINDEQHSDNAD